MESSERSFRAAIPVSAALLLLALFAVAPPASAADGVPDFCDAGLVGSDALSYQVREGNRCEGQYVTKVSGSNLVVASFEGPAYGPPLVQDGHIGLRLAMNPGDDGIRVRVRAMKPRTYYFMDAQLDQAPYSWSTRILDDIGLAPADLGVLAMMDLPEGGVAYVPVRFNSQGPEVDHPRVVLLPQRVASQMFLSVQQVDEAGKPVGPPLRSLADLGLRLYPAHRPVPVDLPELKGAQGRFKIEVGARLQGGGTAHHDFLVFLP